jgi:hypothetical protein
MPVLADIFSAGNTLKRRFKDFAANPGAFLETEVNYRNQKAGEFNTLQELATQGDINKMRGLPVTPDQQAAELRLRDIVAGAYNPIGMTTSASLPKTLTRSEIQAEAKSLGLPSKGKTEELQKLIETIKADPKSWSEEQYQLVRPYLSIHQDFRPNSSERVESIMREGLKSGMVDSLDAIEKGQYSYSRGLIGSDAYLFPSRALKYRSQTDPHLAPGNKPLFKISPQKGQDIYEAIKTTAEKTKTDDPLMQFLGQK